MRALYKVFLTIIYVIVFDTGLNCPQLDIPTNGSVVYIVQGSPMVINPGERVPATASALYNCNRPLGFRLEGTLSRTCEFDFDTETVDWSEGETPMCIFTSCDDIILPNGTVTYEQSDTRPDSVDISVHLENDTARFGCSPGFVLSDSTNSICNGEAMRGVLISLAWAPGIPTCDPQCPRLAVNSSRGIGQISTTEERRLGESAIYTCQSGLINTTTLTRVCQEDGEWSEPEPICDPICLNLSPLINGQISYSPDTTPRVVREGEVIIANYTCNDGFVLRGNYRVRMCERSLEAFGSFQRPIARWNREAPICVPTTCPLIIRGRGVANITYSPSDRSIGSIATHVCNPGLLPNNDSVRTCEQDNESPTGAAWDQPEETCRAVCNDLPPLRNGTITYSRSDILREVGTVATYACNLGFRYVGGNTIRTCTEEERNMELVGAFWSGTAGLCIPECPPLPNLENGRITYTTTLPATPNYIMDTIADHECNDGFVLLGIERRVCLDSGEWSGEQPRCERIQCPILPPLGNGTIEYNMEMNPVDFNLETTANYSCNSGFELVGPMVRTCIRNQTHPDNPDGEWNLFAPFCRPICLELTLENGVIMYSVDTSSPFDNGTVATHVCNPGFALVGVMERVCVDSLTWSDEPPSCEAIMCRPLDDPPNGRLDYTTAPLPNYALGTTATPVCNVGFTAMGGPKVCEQFNDTSVIGVWTGPPCFCEPNTCPPLPGIPKGEVIYTPDSGTSEYDVGTVASYICVDSNCCLSANNSRVCQTDGTWSGSEPECQLIGCLELPPIANGTILYSTIDLGVGTIATYTCTSPYVLVGTPTRTCLTLPGAPDVLCDNGMWSNGNRSCQLPPSTTFNDTATGDPLLTIPLYIRDKSALVNPITGLMVRDNETVSLCFELHGRSDSFFNLVSDVCTNVNAHYNLVLPDTPQENINIIDNIYVRAVDNDGVCRNIEVALNEGGICTASVDDLNIDPMYQRAGITVRRYRNRVRIVVPNCNTNNLNLVMWVFCLRNTFWSSFRVDSNGMEVTFDAYMLRFVIARGVNLQPTSHGIIGQFWNVPIQVDQFNGNTRESVTNLDNYYEITVTHPDDTRRRFSGWLWPLTWEYREEYCLYAGNQQAGPIYEVLNPNDPVIEGTYAAYLVNDTYSTDFMFNRFEELRCFN